MECGKLTAKLRDAVPVIFFEEGREVKRFRNIEIPDEIKKLEYMDFKFDMPEDGHMSFKIYFEVGTLPEVWPEVRTRKHRGAKVEEEPEKIEAEQREIMEINYNVTGERRKAMVQAIGKYLGENPYYMGVPTYAYKIGEYFVSKTGVVTGPVDDRMTEFLGTEGFIAE